MQYSGIPANPVLIGLKTQSPVPTTNPIASFQATFGSGATGVSVVVTCGANTPATSVILSRGFDPDPLHAQQVATYAGPFKLGQQINYTDSDATTLQANVAYYFLQIVYGSGADQSIQNAGPVAAYINGVSQLSAAPAAFSLSTTSGAGAITIGCSFAEPDSSNFGSVQLLAKGYLGIGSYQAVVQSSQDPFSFTLQATGENVMFQLVALNNQGVGPLVGPTLSLTLLNVTSVPAIVFGGSALALANGVQISYPAGPETNITTYGVYRGAVGGTFSGATLLATISSTGVTTYTLVDPAGSTANQYYVVANNAIGHSAPSPAIVPTATYSAATAGTGAAGTPVPLTTGTIQTAVSVNMTNQGTGYYQIPLATFSASTYVGGAAATGYCTVDGAGHVNAVILSNGGVYATTDTITVSIHY